MASLASIKTDLRSMNSDPRFLVDVSDNELGRRLLEDWDFVLRLLSGIAVKEAKTFELTEIIWGFFKACGREMELIQACLEYEVAHCMTLCFLNSQPLGTQFSEKKLPSGP